MSNSGGALLTEVYGSDTIKVKKKDKKANRRGQTLRGQDILCFLYTVQLLILAVRYLRTSVCL